jgi:hypothetical protein
MAKQQAQSAEEILKLIDQLPEDERNHFWHLVAINPALSGNILRDPESSVHELFRLLCEMALRIHKASRRELAEYLEKANATFRQWKEKWKRRNRQSDPKTQERNDWLLACQEELGLDYKAMRKKAEAENSEWLPLSDSTVKKGLQEARKRARETPR